MKNMINNLMVRPATAFWSGLLLYAPEAFTSAITLLFLLLLTGCDSHREYRCSITSEEAVPVNQIVTLDGRTVGTVSGIRQEGAVRVAVVRINDRAGQSAMRVGVEREQRGAEMRLSSANVKPDAAPLDPATALIPTRAPIEHAARKTLDGAHEVFWRVRDWLADHPAVCIAAGLVVLVVFITFLCRWFRRACALLLVIALLALAASAFAGDTRQPGYSRDYLRLEQKSLEDHLSKAQAEVDLARARRAGGLNEMAERNLLAAQIALDGFKVEAAGHADRIRALRASPLAYHRENQIKILTDNFNEMRGRQGRLLEEITRMRQAPATVTNGPPQILKSVSPITNTLLITNTVEKAVIKTVVITNTVEKPVIKTVVITNTVKAEHQTPLTKKVVIIRTNQVVVTNQERVFLERIVTNAMAAAKEANTNSGLAAEGGTGGVSAVRAGTGLSTSMVTAGQKKTEAAEGTGKATRRGRQLAAAAAAAGMLLVAGAGFWIYLSSANGETYRILLVAGGQMREFETAGLEQGVILDGSPRVEDLAGINGNPCIIATRLGARLRVAKEGCVLVNEKPVLETRRLAPGDRLEASGHKSEPTHSFTFLDCAPVVSAQSELIEDTEMRS